ncbi:MAG: hypothetical protein HC842_09650 [Cytophagales bacterium]|nr:hypothetical protein [Cytophagales bacterium]
MNDKKKLLKSLKGALAWAAVRLDYEVVFETFRGDGFQAAVERPEDALVLGLGIRTFCAAALIIALLKPRGMPALPLG